MTQHLPLHLPRAIRCLYPASALRLLALLGLFLLPMQMRAGMEFVHPHALLQLLLDASDNVIDHHPPATVTPDHGPGDYSNHSRRSATAPSDLPTFESILMAAGGLALSLVALVLFFLTSMRERVWPCREAWSGRLVLPELPPPRPCGI